jgi:hypothetical protein
MVTANTDDLESIQLDPQDEEEEEEEEMDEIVINPNNYDEKFDLDEDKQTFVKQFILFFIFIFFQFEKIERSKIR